MWVFISEKLHCPVQQQCHGQDDQEHLQSSRSYLWHNRMTSKASPPELLARLIQDLKAASVNNMNLDTVDSSSQTSKDMRDTDNNRHVTRRPSQRSKVAGKRLNFGSHSGKYDHKLNFTPQKICLFLLIYAKDNISLWPKSISRSSDSEFSEFSRKFVGHIF